MTRRIILLTLCIVSLASCRLDVAVSVVVQPDGTGQVAVQATADAELIAKVPDLAETLSLDDAIANGWEVAGPTATETGGLTITLTHKFRSAEELTNVLNSVGPPLSTMSASRVTLGDLTTNNVSGTLVLADGFASFADADLIAAAGGLPFATEFEASATTPADSMSVTLSVDLPGKPTGDEDDEAQIWSAPLDGTSLAVAASTVQKPAGANGWAGPVATGALVILIVWVAASVVFIAFVVIARRRKRRRSKRRKSVA